MQGEDEEETVPRQPRVINSKFLGGVKGRAVLEMEEGDSSMDLEASAESPEASAESIGDELVAVVSKSGAGGGGGRGGGGSFTAPRVPSSWKENEPAAGTGSGSSSWSMAKPRAAPAGPPPASMAAAALKKPAPAGRPPASLLAAAASSSSSSSSSSAAAGAERQAARSSGGDDSDVDELDAERSAAIAPGGDGDGKEQDEDKDEDEDEDDEEEEGDDVIRRPIVHNGAALGIAAAATAAGAALSPFEAYAAEKRASGITLARRSGYYDDDDENGAQPPIGAKKTAFASSSSSSSYSSPYPFVLVAHDRGLKNCEHVQCTIYRDRSTVHTKLYPEYQLVLDATKKPLLLARKMSLNMTSNYHVFDLTRGVAGSKLSKKSGNYLGKLRAQNSARTEYVLVTNSTGREEVGGIIFERLTLLDQLKAGSQPRKMTVLVPALDANNLPIPTRPAAGDESVASMLKAPQEGNGKGMFVLESKMPVFENGNYRLNFKGRVNLPSVKNFQLVSPADISDVICQFGKVNDDKFHLDFKAPLNAFQAFSLALTQFNL